MRARTAPDQGLPVEFLERTADLLTERGVPALVEFPGVLEFSCQGRQWLTGYTGLHVHSGDDNADRLPGDQHLVELERCGGVTAEQYADAIVAVCERRVAV